tara:strand:- start:172 stop:357 length:186 start_codon:yes stop_codon:yes gene_type:complete
MNNVSTDQLNNNYDDCTGCDVKLAYACGLDAMIKSAQNLLSAARLPMNYFFLDAFIASSPN